MSAIDKMRTIMEVRITGPTTLHLVWSDGTKVDLSLETMLNEMAFAKLNDPVEFSGVALGEWGHSIAWPSGIELGADVLWRETLSATGHNDARLFLEWRLRHALSLSKAAEALGISRRMVAYYSNGDKKIPKPILLACRGWEVITDSDKAA
ncbi:MAG: DUF2442 domain-containing protein [Aliidongia sp.]